MLIQEIRSMRASRLVLIGFVVLLSAGVFAEEGMWMPQQIPALASKLLVLGFTAPTLLKWPSAVWWKFAITLGWINARVILTVAFALVLTPMGLLWRLIGRDPLARHRRNWPGWSSYPARYQDRDHFTRMY